MDKQIHRRSVATLSSAFFCSPVKRATTQTLLKREVRRKWHSLQFVTSLTNAWLKRTRRASNQLSTKTTIMPKTSLIQHSVSVTHLFSTAMVIPNNKHIDKDDKQNLRENFNWKTSWLSEWMVAVEWRITDRYRTRRLNLQATKLTHCGTTPPPIARVAEYQLPDITTQVNCQRPVFWCAGNGRHCAMHQSMRWATPSR